MVQFEDVNVLYSPGQHYIGQIGLLIHLNGIKRTGFAYFFNQTSMDIE